MKKKILTFCLYFVLASIAYVVLTKTVFAPDKVDVGMMMLAGMGAGIAAVSSDTWLPWLLHKILGPQKK